MIAKCEEKIAKTLAGEAFSQQPIPMGAEDGRPTGREYERMLLCALERYVLLAPFVPTTKRRVASDFAHCTCYHYFFITNFLLLLLFALPTLAQLRNFVSRNEEG